MKSRFISMLCVTVTIFASSAVLAETVIVECPKVYTTNPFTLLRVENGEGWEKSESSGYNLFNRCGVDPQGYMKCYYGAAAHGASDLYMLKKCLRQIQFVKSRAFRVFRANLSVRLNRHRSSRSKFSL